MKLDYKTDHGVARVRFGLVVLATDETIESEFATMSADLDISIHHARIPMVASVSSTTLATMKEHLPAAAALLPEALDSGVIGYACTSASTVIGAKAVTQAIRSIYPKARVTNPLSAIIAGAEFLGARRLGFLTPYVADVSQSMQQRLVDAGFEVTAFGTFDQADDRIVARISEASIISGALSVMREAPCDALVISCTNLRCLSLIAGLEAEAGIPVITSNQALFWHMQKLSGLDVKNKRWGRLFAHEE